MECILRTLVVKRMNIGIKMSQLRAKNEKYTHLATLNPYLQCLH